METEMHYQVVVRPKSDFVAFRTRVVDQAGRTQRVEGKRRGGRWATHAWLIHRDDAHLDQEGSLILHTNVAPNIKRQLPKGR